MLTLPKDADDWENQTAILYRPNSVKKIYNDLTSIDCKKITNPNIPIHLNRE